MQKYTCQLTPEENTEFTAIAGLLKKNALISDFLFFDIETTGLDIKCCYIYLISYICVENGQTMLTQLFSEDISEEGPLLEDFKKTAVEHRYLVNYNGRRFDMGFINSRYALYSTKKYFTVNECIDIYEYISPYKNVLNLKSMKQVNLELFCGYKRNESFSGKELITLYLTYLAASKTARNRLKSTLISDKKHFLEKDFSTCPDSGLSLLGNIDIDYTYNAILNHGHEDLVGMLKLCGLIRFIDGLNNYGSYSVNLVYRDINPEKNMPIIQNLNADAEITGYIDITVSLSKILDDFILQKALLKNLPEDIYSNGELCFTLPCTKMTLKLFYSNYRDYNYLPGEDTAIHKNASWFLDSSLRIKATPETCYTRHTGSFLLFPPMEINEVTGYSVFRNEYHSKYTYISVNELLKADDVKKAVMLRPYFIYLLKDPQKFLKIFEAHPYH